MVDELRLSSTTKKPTSVSSREERGTYPWRDASNWWVGSGTSAESEAPVERAPHDDYAREAIFSMLESRGGLYDLVVADLYCGSGAMGIEAMSRGAAKVLLVDTDPACLAAVKANLEPLGFDAEAVFVRAMLPVWSPPDDLDLVLADPPYGRSTSRAY